MFTNGRWLAARQPRQHQREHRPIAPPSRKVVLTRTEPRPLRILLRAVAIMADSEVPTITETTVRPLVNHAS
jgi:hypothetical protein